MAKFNDPYAPESVQSNGVGASAPASAFRDPYTESNSSGEAIRAGADRLAAARRKTQEEETAKVEKARQEAAALKAKQDEENSLGNRLSSAAGRGLDLLESAPLNPAGLVKHVASGLFDPEPEMVDYKPSAQAPVDPAIRVAVEDGGLKPKLLAPGERQPEVLSAPEAPEANPLNIAKGLISSLGQGGEATRQGIRAQYADAIGSEGMAADAQLKADRNRNDIQDASPEFKTETAQGLYSGVSSLVQQLPGMAASIATGNPLPALASAGLTAEAEAYTRYKGRGASTEEALMGAMGEGAVEVLTELTPMKFIIDKFGKQGAAAFIGGFLARDAIPEQVATLAQDAIDTAIANPDKTWGEYLAERPSAAYQTLLATVAQAGAMGAANKIAFEAKTADANPTIQAFNRGITEGVHTNLTDANLQQARDVALQNNLNGAASDVIAAFDAEAFRRQNLGTLERATEEAVRKEHPINQADTGSAAPGGPLEAAAIQAAPLVAEAQAREQAAQAAAAAPEPLDLTTVKAEQLTQLAPEQLNQWATTQPPTKVMSTLKLINDSVLRSQLVDSLGLSPIATAKIHEDLGHNDPNTASFQDLHNAEMKGVDLTAPVLDDIVLPQESAQPTQEGVQSNPDPDLAILQDGVHNDIINQTNAATAAANAERAAQGLEPLAPATSLEQTGDAGYNLQEVPESTLSIPPGTRLGIRLIAKAFGKKVRYIQDAAGRELPFHGAYGASIGADENTIFLDAKGDVRLSRVVGHEIAHALRTQAPQIYKVLEAELSPLIDATTAKADLEGRGYADGKTLNAKWGKDGSVYKEETIADMIGDKMVDPKFWLDVAKKMTAAKAQEFFSRSLEVLSNALKVSNGYPLSGQDKKTMKAAHGAIVKAMADYKTLIDSGKIKGAGVAAVDTTAERVEENADGVQFSKKDEAKFSVLKREKASGRYVGAPDWVGSSTAEVAKLYKKVLGMAVEGESGKYWYEKSSKAVLDLVGGDKAEAEKFVGLLAIYSQGTEVGVNTGFALEAYYQWKAGLPIETGRFPTEQTKKANMWLKEGKDWGGIKTNNFYVDLMEEISPAHVDHSHATMDMWMALAYDYGMKVLDQGPKYTFAKTMTELVAKELGWKPHQVQAAVWSSVKTRIEATEKERVAQERKTGIQTQNEDGTWSYTKGREYDHFRLAHKLGMKLKITPEEIAAKGFNYEDALNQRMVQMSWEATPSVAGGSLPGIHSAPLAQKMEYLEAVAKALTKDGKNLIAEAVGLHSPPTLFGVSAWEGQVGAGAQSFLPAPILGTKGKRAVIPVARNLLNDYAALMGLVLKQDAVVWHHAVYDNANAAKNGMDLVTNRALTDKEIELLYLRVYDRFGTWEIAPGYTASGAKLLNFVEGLDNKAFQKGIDEIIEGLPDSFGGGFVEHRGFRSDGEYVGNNWKEYKNGEEYQERLRARRPDLLTRAEDLRARVEAVDRKFSAKYKWGAPSFSRKGLDQRGSERAADAAARPGEGSVDVNGTHFSNQQRQSLDGRYYGTGIKGAEQDRVMRSPDRRLHSRLYFYIDEGKGVKPEAGVGKFAHNVDLTNLYDTSTRKLSWEKDPYGDNAVTMDSFESAVLNAGYSGYYRPGAFGDQGVAVMLGDAAIGVKPSAVPSFSRKAKDELNVFMDKVYATYPANPFNGREVIVDNAAAVELYPFDGSIHLASIRTFEKGTGQGSKVLAAVTAIADEAGVDLTLTAKPFATSGAKGLNTTQLKAWYARHGFKNAGYGEMIREARLVLRFSRKEVSQMVLINETAKHKKTWGRHIGVDQIKMVDQEKDAGFKAKKAGMQLNAAYIEAAKQKDTFDGYLKAVADKLGLKDSVPGLKGRFRTVEKLIADYGSDVSKLKDMLRGTIETESLTQARELYLALREIVPLANVSGNDKSSLDPSKPAASEAGYRDAKLIIDVNGVPAELIIAPAALLRAKGIAHSYYEDSRSLMAKVGTASPAAVLKLQARIDELDAKMVEIYSPAVERSQSSSASLRVHGSELSRELGVLSGLLTGSNANLGLNLKSVPSGSSATGMPSKSKNLVPSGRSDSGVLTDMVDTSNTDSIPQGKGEVQFSRKPFQPAGHEDFVKSLDRVRKAYVPGGYVVSDKSVISGYVEVSATPLVFDTVKKLKAAPQGTAIVGTGSSIYLKGSNQHEGSSHNAAIPDSVLNRLPELLADPVAIYDKGAFDRANPKTDKSEDVFLVVLPVQVAGQYVTVAIAPRTTILGKTVVNFIKSVHTRAAKTLNLYTKHMVYEGITGRKEEAPDTGPVTMSGDAGAKVQHVAGLGITIRPSKGIDKVKSRNDVPKFSRRAPGAGSRFALPEETAGREITRIAQNDQVRWLDQVNAIRDRGGVVDDQNDVYQAMERMSARAMYQTEDFFAGYVTPILKEMRNANVTLDEMGEYLYALHAKERNAEIRKINPQFTNAGYDDVGGSGMSDKEADEIVARVKASPKAADLSRFAKNFRAWSEANLVNLVQGGLLSQDQADIMRKTYPNYVPLRGYADGSEADGFMGQGSGFSTAKRLFNKALGRKSRAYNPAVYIMHSVAEGMLAKEKANVGRYLERLIRQNPDTKLWTIGKPEKDRVNGPNGQVIERDMGYDKEKEVRFIRDGKEVRIQVKDPLLLRAYNNLGVEPLHNLLKVSGAINAFLRQMWTQKNPVFPLVNVLRDIPSSILYATGEHGFTFAMSTAAYMPKAFKAAWQMAGQKPVSGSMATTFEEFRAAGGGIGFRMISDIESTVNKIQTLQKKLGQQTITQALIEGDLKQVGKRILWRTYNNAVIDLIERINSTFENMSRIAIFAAARGRDMEVAEAARMSKNVTVNFNRRGEQGVNANALFLFMNAAVQGLAKDKRSVTDAAHKNQARAVLGSYAMLGFALAAMMLDDDEEELIQENANVTAIKFRVGDSTVTLPLPYASLGFSYYLGRSAFKMLSGDATVGEQSLRLGSALLTHLSPINPIPNADDPQMADVAVAGTPTAVKLPMMVVLNRNSFGSAMRPDYNNDPDAYKAFRGTRGSVYAELSAWMNESTGGTTRESGAVDVSPETIKGMVNYALGGTGRFVGDAASTGADLLTTGGAEVNKIPVVNRFVKTEDVSVYRSRFYSQAGVAKDKLELLNKYIKDRNVEKRKELMPWMQLGRKGNALWKRMNSLRDEELQVSRDDSLTTAEKGAKLKDLETRQIAIANDYHRMYKEKTKAMTLGE